MISEESLRLRRRLKIFPKGIINKFPRVRISDDVQSEAYKWCQENFGERWVWSSPINTDYTDLYFVEPEDALICRLRFLAYTA